MVILLHSYCHWNLLDFPAHFIPEFLHYQKIAWVCFALRCTPGIFFSRYHCGHCKNFINVSSCNKHPIFYGLCTLLRNVFTVRSYMCCSCYFRLGKGILSNCKTVFLTASVGLVKVASCCYIMTFIIRPLVLLLAV